MPTLKIIHTADWQLVRPYGRLPVEVANALSEARLDAIDRLGSTASTHGARHVLVAGDVFDNVDPGDRIVGQAISRMERFDVTWWLMPGNHDHVRPGGLWSRIRRLAPPGVRIVDTLEAVELEPDAWLLPAPLEHRKTVADARVHAGDFLALVVSRDGERAAIQGFGGGGMEAHSRYWVETPQHLIDVGPHLLAKGSSLPAAPLPILWRNKSEPLPLALRHRVVQRYAPDATMVFPAPIATRMSAFLDDLAGRWLAKSGAEAPLTAVLTGDDALLRFARRGVWARGAQRLQGEADPTMLPF